MTDTLAYFALAIAVSFAALYIKQVRADFALCVTLAGAAVLFSGIIPRLSLLIGDIQSFSALDGIPNEYIISVLKIIGIAYIAEFATDICTDAGERTLAKHIETIGKVTVAFIALPIVEDVFSLIINLLE